MTKNVTISSHKPHQGTFRSHSKRLLRTREAAVYLSLSNWKLRDLVANGKLPVVQADEGSPFLFDVCDLDNWAEEHKRMT